MLKTAAAIATVVLTESLKEGQFKMIGRFAALGVVLNNGVEAFRLVPRYVAGLQGSLQMALDRWRSIQETGADPFDQGGKGGTRMIHKPIDNIVNIAPDSPNPSEINTDKTAKWTDSIQPKDLKNEVAAANLFER